MIKALMILFFLTFFFVPLKYLNAKESDISIKMVANNCNGCHHVSGLENNFIPSLKKLSKEKFVEKMNKYKSDDGFSIMSRINKVLSREDIINLSEFYY